MLRRDNASKGACRARSHPSLSRPFGLAMREVRRRAGAALLKVGCSFARRGDMCRTVILLILSASYL